MTTTPDSLRGIPSHITAPPSPRALQIYRATGVGSSLGGFAYRDASTRASRRARSLRVPFQDAARAAPGCPPSRRSALSAPTYRRTLARLRVTSVPHEQGRWREGARRQCGQGRRRLSPRRSRGRRSLSRRRHAAPQGRPPRPHRPRVHLRERRHPQHAHRRSRRETPPPSPPRASTRHRHPRRHARRHRHLEHPRMARARPGRRRRLRLRRTRHRSRRWRPGRLRRTRRRGARRAPSHDGRRPGRRLGTPPRTPPGGSDRVRGDGSCRGRGGGAKGRVALGARSRRRARFGNGIRGRGSRGTSGAVRLLGRGVGSTRRAGGTRGSRVRGGGEGRCASRGARARSPRTRPSRRSIGASSDGSRVRSGMGGTRARALRGGRGGVRSPGRGRGGGTVRFGGWGRRASRGDGRADVRRVGLVMPSRAEGTFTRGVEKSRGGGARAETGRRRARRGGERRARREQSERLRGRGPRHHREPRADGSVRRVTPTRDVGSTRRVRVLESRIQRSARGGGVGGGGRHVRAVTRALPGE